MKNELTPIAKPIAVTVLSLGEQDFLECQRALLGKRITFLYTVVSVCCASVIGICLVAEQIGIGSPEQTKFVFVVLACLLLASVFYFGVPKWLGTLRYRQYMTSNTKPKSVAFYSERFELLVDDTVTDIYRYTMVQRIIKSENLFIMVISNMLYLPIRYCSISEESWSIIEKYITEAMDTHPCKIKEHTDK